MIGALSPSSNRMFALGKFTEERDVVVRVEPGGKVASLSRRADVEPERFVRVADVGVSSDQILVVTAGVVAVGGLEDVAARGRSGRS